MPLSNANRRRFTDAARAAALEARRRKREQALPRGIPEVFVVRGPAVSLGYGWEIRRFGRAVLDRSPTTYSPMPWPPSAGHSALNSPMCEA